MGDLWREAFYNMQSFGPMSDSFSVSVAACKSNLMPLPSNWTTSSVAKTWPAISTAWDWSWGCKNFCERITTAAASSEVGQHGIAMNLCITGDAVPSSTGQIYRIDCLADRYNQATINIDSRKPWHFYNYYANARSIVTKEEGAQSNLVRWELYVIQKSAAKLAHFPSLPTIPMPTLGNLDHADIIPTSSNPRHSLPWSGPYETCSFPLLNGGTPTCHDRQHTHCNVNKFLFVII